MRKGYITVFFSLAISLCLSLLMGLIYGVRENAIRLKASESVEISLRSCFGEYQRELWKRYNLVFTDASYGYNVGSMILPEVHMLSAINRNFDENTLSIIGGKDLLKLTAFDVYTDAVRFATDDVGQSIKNQAVKCMKYKYGIGYINAVYDELFETEEYELCEEDLSEIEEAAEASENLNMPVIGAKTEEFQNLVKGQKNVSLLSTLRLVLPDISKVSTTKINKAVLYEKRAHNQGNLKKDQKSDVTDNLFFSEYLMTYFGNFRSKKENTVLSYETEYLIAGKEADSHNLEAVVNRIFLIRQAANMASLYKDKERMAKIKTMSEIASAILMNPELEPSIELLAVTSWSYLESIDDLKRLCRGEKVPIIKNSDEWRTSLFSQLIPDVFEEKSDKGIRYEDYLRFFLATAKEETVRTRMMNLLELNVRNSAGNENFRLDYCFDAWSVTAYVSSEYGHSYTVERSYDLENQ